MYLYLFQARVVERGRDRGRVRQPEAVLQGFERPGFKPRRARDQEGARGIEHDRADAVFGPVLRLVDHNLDALVAPNVPNLAGFGA